MRKVCKICGKEYEEDYQDDFCECGGMIEIIGEVCKVEDELGDNDSLFSLVDVVQNQFYDEETFGDSDEKDAEIEESELLDNEETFEEDSSKENEIIEKENLESEFNNKNAGEIESYQNLVIKIFRNKELLMEKEFSIDEVVIGREYFGVDLNLKDYDKEKRISRKHVKIVRENDKYYVVRLSKKIPVYLGKKVLGYNEKVEIKNGDKIILNKDIGMEVFIPGIN